MINILIVSSVYRGSTVYASQIHSACNELAKYNNVTLNILAGIKDYRQTNIAGANYIFNKYVRLPKLQIDWIRNLNYLILRLFSPLAENIKKADIIVVTGLLDARIILKFLKKMKIKKELVYRVRGIAEEHLLQGKKEYFFRLKIIERVIFENFNYFFFVSEQMKEHFVKIYNLDVNNCYVFPSMVNGEIFFRDETLRRKIRNEMGIKEKDIIFVYSGGTSVWQNIDLMLESFKGALEIREDLCFLFITNNKQLIAKKVQDMYIPQNKVKILTCPYKDVGKYLNAADVGLLIRDNILMNKVASPIKLSEYLSIGLDVLTTIKYSEGIIPVEKTKEDIIKYMVGYKRPEKNGAVDRFYIHDVAKKQQRVFERIIMRNN